MADPGNGNIALVKLAIEYWRVARSYERNLANLPNSTSAEATIRNSDKKFSAILAESGLKFISCERQEYSPNLPITVINRDEFTSNDNLIVTQMIEPTIMEGDKVINVGKAILTAKEG